MVITTVQAISQVPQVVKAGVQIVQPKTDTGSGDILPYLDKAESILKIVDSIAGKSETLKSLFGFVAEKKGVPIQSREEGKGNPVLNEKIQERESGHLSSKEQRDTVIEVKEVEKLVVKKIEVETVMAYLDVLAEEQSGKLSPDWRTKTLDGYVEMYKSAGKIKKMVVAEHIATIINELLEKQP